MYLIIVVVIIVLPKTISIDLDLSDINKIEISSRYGLSENHRLWINGIVPIEYDSNIIDADLTIINSVLEEFSNNTCVKFKSRDGEKDYVLIRTELYGCHSNLGRKGGEQIINLQSYLCTVSRGAVLHEVMHTLGFLHEHTRPDRDDWIQILWDNIQEGMESNFYLNEDELTTNFGTQYDYYSIMQYNSFAFSKHPLLPTILPTNPGVVLKNQNKLSDGDVKRINLMYNCNNKIEL